MIVRTAVTPPPDTDPSLPRSTHAVQFYDDDGLLCDRVASFLQAGVESGAALLVIATAVHREAIVARLDARGCEPEALRSRGQLILLDAEETLARFMTSGVPDGTLFEGVVAGALRTSADWEGQGRVRAYGELVDLLWRAGKAEAALRLEEMWNHLAERQGGGTTFSLALPRWSQRRSMAAGVAVTPPAIDNAQDELRGIEERFRLLVDSIKDYAILMLDPTGRVQTWNAGAERIKGYTADEIIGQNFSVFHGEKEVAAGVCREMLETAAREGRVEAEGWRVRKDGSRFWASVVITALRHPKGELLGFAKVTRDLTETRKMEAERIRLVHAQESIRLRDEFLSVVSHELKTPLAGLQLQVENLQRRLDVSDELTFTQLRRATDSTHRLSAIIDSLLDASRIATGRMTLVPERFDLSEAVLECVKRLVPSGAKADCKIVCDLEQSVVGTWDRERLQQAISNLLINAIKYAPAGEIEISLSRSIRLRPPTVLADGLENGLTDGARGEGVVLQIRDHGPGVPQEALARIFGRFERAVSVQNHGGLGLGLYVVREIVGAHGGTVTVENAPDGGARFTLRLPLGPHRSASRVGDSPSADLPQGAAMKRDYRVLVVEDDETIRDSLIEFLDEEGYPAVGAVHGQDAMTKLAAATTLPRLILLDLMMPVMDGKSFREQQMSDPALAAIPVIVLSALVDAERQSGTMKAAAYLKKPFALAQLLGLVRQHCGAALPE